MVRVLARISTLVHSAQFEPAPRVKLDGQSERCRATFKGYSSVQTQRPRARRYSFVATVELTDLRSETNIHVRTSDLSLYGCCVETHRSLPAGTRVRVRIAHNSANFVALGRVTYANAEGKMGIVFALIDPKDRLVLDEWLEELRHN